MAGLYYHILVCPSSSLAVDTLVMEDSDWADFDIPAAFGPKVRNALKAEPRSVRLANLVGDGGSWYGFGKTTMDMCVLSC